MHLDLRRLPEGFLDDVDLINKVYEFEQALLEYFQRQGQVRSATSWSRRRSFKKLKDEFKAACQDFKSGWSG